MMTFFQAFVKFRERHRGWGGKRQFKKYYKKIKIRKNEELEKFLVKCIIAKMLDEKKLAFLCDVNIDGIIDVYDVENFKAYKVNEIDIPKEVKETIYKLRKFVEEEVF